MSSKSKRSHGGTCACGCGQPFTDGAGDSGGGPRRNAVLQTTLAAFLDTVPMSDEARERITEVMREGEPRVDSRKMRA
jgi:hypothetical protein